MCLCVMTVIVGQSSSLIASVHEGWPTRRRFRTHCADRKPVANCSILIRKHIVTHATKKRRWKMIVLDCNLRDFCYSTPCLPHALPISICVLILKYRIINMSFYSERLRSVAAKLFCWLYPKNRFHGEPIIWM